MIRFCTAYIESEARKAGAKDIRLYADTSNDDAKATYGQLGFTTGHYQVFEKPLAE
jgi:ribosomal protein S18 acetylase RimI-like enzyme